MPNRDYENRRFMADEQRERWPGREQDENYRSGEAGRRPENPGWQGGQETWRHRGSEYYNRPENRDFDARDFDHRNRGFNEQSTGGRSYGDYSFNQQHRSFDQPHSHFGNFENRNVGNENSANYNWPPQGTGNFNPYGTGNLRTTGFGGGQDLNNRFGGGYDRGYYGRNFGDEYSRRDFDERGPFEKFGDKLREGWQRLQGRGPKAYTRSDDRIREDIYDRLMSGWFNAENVEVQVKTGEVYLTGTVENRQDKRRIEDMAEEVLGVKDVHNQIKVGRTEAQNITVNKGATPATGGRS